MYYGLRTRMSVEGEYSYKSSSERSGPRRALNSLASTYSLALLYIRPLWSCTHLSNESSVETSLVTKPTAYDSDGVEDQSSQNKFHWLSIGPMERSNIIPMSF